MSRFRRLSAEPLAEGLALKGVHATGEGSAGLGTVVVTGVCGFIGSHLALRLLRRSATVLGVDRRPLHAAERIGSPLRRLQDQPGFRLLTASVEDPEVTRCLRGASAVVHWAAATDVAASWGAGFVDHAASVLSTQRLLDRCGREGVGGGVLLPCVRRGGRWTRTAGSSINGLKTIAILGEWPHGGDRRVGGCQSGSCRMCGLSRCRGSSRDQR